MQKCQLFSALCFVAFLILVSSIPFSKASRTRNEDWGNRNRYRSAESTSFFLIPPSLSLSLSGSMNLHKTMQTVGKVAEGVASFVTLDMVEALVDLSLDQMPWLNDVLLDSSDRVMAFIDSEAVEEGITNRMDVVDRKAIVKDEMITLIGAFLGKQRCREKTLCFVGCRLHKIKGAGELILVAAEHLLPSDFNSTLSIVREGKTLGLAGPEHCQRYYECQTTAARRLEYEIDQL